ncbi:MAG: hypothetical protein CMM30_02175 [Rhodospirillaceae bacterium]|nr:hypothetical protein [Rhodospirillaceae bacterium]|tara:strand:- start:9252 stop:9674 length:423 start_codon:yes stop_codon:yes gene_type:complete
MGEGHFHHVHIFCTDISKSIDWWQTNFSAEICFDDIMGGSRNVFVRVGEGRLHFYDQAPKTFATGTIHHLGIRVENLGETVLMMKNNGVEFRNPIRSFDGWAYSMCLAPDNILLELFEVSNEIKDPKLLNYFSDSSSHFL